MAAGQGEGLTAVQAAAPDVRSGELVENAKIWDGRPIRFKGEAIGERMTRGAMAWIHLNDDPYMWKNIEEGAKLGGYNSGHAVWIPAALASMIRFFGNFRNSGDVVQITGTFHAVCREHGGDMDIHADTLEILQVGRFVSNPLNKRRAALAGLLFVLSALLLLARKQARRHRA